MPWLVIIIIIIILCRLYYSIVDVHLGSRSFFHFLDTFLHLLNLTTGTINCAIYSNLYAFDREFNSTPYHSARIFILGFVCATIELLISFVY